VRGTEMDRHHRQLQHIGQGQSSRKQPAQFGLVSIVIIGVLVTAGTGWINSITSNVTSAIG